MYTMRSKTTTEHAHQKKKSDIEYLRLSQNKKYQQDDIFLFIFEFFWKMPFCLMVQEWPDSKEMQIKLYLHTATHINKYWPREDNNGPKAKKIAGNADKDVWVE